MPQPTKKPAAEFLRGYLEAALWTESDTLNDEALPDENGEELHLDDAGFGLDDFAPEAIKSARTDCADFLFANRRQLRAAAEWYMSESNTRGPYTMDTVFELLGHDFWLTRNGHGVGFWDRGFPGSLGDELSDMTRPYGETSAYVGDDGQIYFTH